MFRLSSMKLSQWRQASKAVTIVAAQTSEMSTKNAAIAPAKKDKPNPNADAKKKEEKPVVVIDED